MASYFRSIANTRRRSATYYQTNRTLVDISTIKWVRDRGLDHAVEKENNLKPMINIKNFINSEPSKSIPISIIVDNKETLQIPTRPIEFIRNYPSIFEQFLPGGIGVLPHIRLTPEVLNLDAEEQLMYQSDSYRQQAADRLLKLLMLVRINKIPLSIVDRLKWDLGLPQDYAETLVPEFPDYFQITDNGDCDSGSKGKRVLELVCWSDKMATSVMEKKAKNLNEKMGNRNRTRNPFEFPLQYSRGFEMDKKFQKSVEDWQKLPYISPYENAFHLPSSSDEADKWAVAVLHELLHILVPKKTEKENVLCLGEYLGLRSRFKRALLHHPGIFYVSSKIGTHTVVLREAYKRDLLFEKHIWMNMRSQYVHLMHTVKELPKAKNAPQQQQQQQQQKTENSNDKGEEEDESGEKQKTEVHNSSDSEDEDVSDDEYDDEDDDDEEEESDDENQTGARKNYAVGRGGRNKRTNLGVKQPLRYPAKEKQAERYNAKTKDQVPSKLSNPTEMHNRHRGHGRVSERSDSPRGRGRPLPDKTVPSKFSKQTEMHNGHRGHGRVSERSDSPRGRGRPLPDKTVPSKFSKQTEMHNGHRGHGRVPERSDSPRGRGRSLPDKTVPSKFSKQTEMHNGHRGHGRVSERSNSLRGRGRSSPDETVPSKLSLQTERCNGYHGNGRVSERSNSPRGRGRTST